MNSKKDEGYCKKSKHVRIYPTESQIQCAIVEWAKNMKFGEYRIGDFLVKITNEGKRSLFNGKRMKMEGLKKGVSDLFLAYPVRVPSGFVGRDPDIIKPGLWLEVKSEKGKITEEQKEWGQLMVINGYSFDCVYSVDEGIEVIKNYLGIKQ